MLEITGDSKSIMDWVNGHVKLKTWESTVAIPSLANAMSSLLRSCSRGCIPASPWRIGNGAPGRSARVGSSRPSPRAWTPTSSFRLGPAGPPSLSLSLSLSLSRSSSASLAPLLLLFLACFAHLVSACVHSQPFRVFCPFLGHMSRSEIQHCTRGKTPVSHMTRDRVNEFKWAQDSSVVSRARGDCTPSYMCPANWN